MIWLGIHFYRETQYEFIRAQRDHASDVDVLFSTRAYQKTGFWKAGGRVYIEGTTAKPSYKGYPPLPNWGRYLLSQIGIRGIIPARRAVAVLAMLGLCLLGWAVALLLNWKYALGTMTYVALFPFYVWGGANLHHLPYGFFLLPFFLLALIGWERKPESFGRSILLVGASFLLSLSTYEYVIYSLIVGGGYLYLKRHSWQAVWMALWRIGLGTALALMLWYGINILEKGWGAFWDDLVYRFTRRASGGGDSTFDWRHGLLRYFYRFEKDLGPGTLATLALFLAWAWHDRRRRRLAFVDKLIILFWLASVSWTLAMFNHAMHHSYFVVPRTYYVAAALTVVRIVFRLAEAWRQGHGFRSAAAGLGLVLIIYFQLDRGMELWALHREPLVPPRARQLIKAHASTPSLVLFHNDAPKEEIKVWKYFLSQASDTVIEARLLQSPFSFDDSLRTYCPHVALLIVKERNSLFYQLYEPDRGGILSRLMRRYATKPPKPPAPAVQALMRRLRLCPRYEDARYVLIYPCNCRADAH